MSRTPRQELRNAEREWTATKHSRMDTSPESVELKWIDWIANFVAGAAFGLIAALAIAIYLEVI